MVDIHGRYSSQFLWFMVDITHMGFDKPAYTSDQQKHSKNSLIFTIQSLGLGARGIDIPNKKSGAKELLRFCSHMMRVVHHLETTECDMHSFKTAILGWIL